MGVGVIVPVEFIVDHIVDTGCGHLVARLEYITLVGHIGVLSSVIGHSHKRLEPKKPSC